MDSQKNYSALEYILLALVPYSRPNLKLSFKPRAFFYDLEHISRRPKNTLKSTMSKAIRRGLIERVDGLPVLTEKGLAKIAPLKARKLKKDVRLMVAFDIPEEIRYKRRQLRTFLQIHHFKQAQKSLWTSEFDYRKELKMVVDELDIGTFVDIYECAKI